MGTLFISRVYKENLWASTMINPLIFSFWWFFALSSFAFYEVISFVAWNDSSTENTRRKQKHVGLESGFLIFYISTPSGVQPLFADVKVHL